MIRSYLTKEQIAEYNAALEQCNGNKNCLSEVDDKYKQISYANYEKNGNLLTSYFVGFGEGFIDAAIGLVSAVSNNISSMINDRSIISDGAKGMLDINNHVSMFRDIKDHFVNSYDELMELSLSDDQGAIGKGYGEVAGSFFFGAFTFSAGRAAVIAAKGGRVAQLASKGATAVTQVASKGATSVGAAISKGVTSVGAAISKGVTSVAWFTSEGATRVFGFVSEATKYAGRKISYFSKNYGYIYNDFLETVKFNKNKFFNSKYATFESIPGTAKGQYSAIKPGPLISDYAETFAGGRYTEVILNKDVVLYRAGHSTRGPISDYFVTKPPKGITQSRIDSAIRPEWRDGATSPIDVYYEIKIPQGTKVYVGEAGTQGGVYVGGTQQIVIPGAKDIKGIKVLDMKELK